MRHTYQKLLFPVLAAALILGCYAYRDHLTGLSTKARSNKASLSKREDDVIPKNTLSQIQQNLAEREYHISFDSLKNTLQSPNRSHGLRAYYKPGQLTIVNRKDSAGHNFRLELVNEGIYADGKKLFEPIQSAQTEQQGNKLYIHHKGFMEEYINDTSGVRQNFIVETAPEGTRSLEVRLAIDGMQVADLGNNELLLTRPNTTSNSEQLSYRDLHCWDANQKPLEASLAYVGGKIQIDVNVENATYPVTIDPLVVNGNPLNANTLLEKNQALANLGASLASAGDVNGDGFSDVIVGAPMYDNNESNEGVAFVYHGSATGLATTPACMLEGNQPDSKFGTSVSTAGDVNGDGFSDVIVGAPMYDKNEKNEGVAFIYHGAAVVGIGTNAVTTLESNQPEANFGQSVALAGDVNNNGFSDVIVGAPMFDKGENNEGAAFIYHGSGLGIASAVGTTLESNQPESQFGASIKGAGDVNGDGFSDVIVGAFMYDKGQNNEGAAFVYHGSPAGIGSGAVTILESNQSTSYFGYSVSTAGDVDGNGFSDVIVGAFLYDNNQNNEGAVFVYHGSQNGIGAGFAKLLEYNQAGAQFGASISAAGDVNGDGFADVIVGANFYDNVQGNEGGAFVYEGSSTGLSDAPASMQESNQVNACLGSSVASAGDVNGDGYSDIVVGSPMYDNGQGDEGVAFVWLGGARSIKETVATHLEMNIPGNQFGWSVASAGDVNGDGFGDVIISANNYDNGETDEGAAFVFHGSTQGLAAVPNMTLEGNQQYASLGSLASAGDVNGDGYGDVIVGIPLYDNGMENTGKVWVLYGSKLGLGMGNLKETTLLGSQEDAKFGSSVSSAGDVNKDGYGDIVIGEPEYDISNPYMDEGRAVIYYGSANGINLNTNPTIINGYTDGVYMGISVAGSIDANGDGFGDVLIGSPWYTSGEDYEGAVFIYYGSQTGVNPANPTILQSNFAFAEMGQVANAGDINGDGFNDIAAGAHEYSNGEASEGALFIFYGLANSINNVPVVLEKNVINGYFGNVSSGGDVNGDGYSDLIVGSVGFSNGQDNEGAVYLLLGSPSGLTTINNVLIEGNQSSAFLGNSVAGAGDVNGDGYNDIIVSAHQYDNNQSNEGRVSVYYGNGGLNAHNNLRLYNSSDLTTPINHTQFSQNNFGAGFFAKSFLGRGKGKLVWETKPLAQGFSKGSNNAITNSTQFTSSQNAYSNLGLVGIELKNVISKQGPSTKVRVRVKYDPALALTGQTYGPWRYLPAYLMGNSTAPVPEDAVSDMSETIKKKANMQINGLHEEVKMYPNPASDVLNIAIKNPDQVQAIKILTTAGSVIYLTDGFKSAIDMNRFSNGTYFVVITNHDGSQTTRKILVTK